MPVRVGRPCARVARPSGASVWAVRVPVWPVRVACPKWPPVWPVRVACPKWPPVWPAPLWPAQSGLPCGPPPVARPSGLPCARPCASPRRHSLRKMFHRSNALSECFIALLLWSTFGALFAILHIFDYIARILHRILKMRRMLHSISAIGGCFIPEWRSTAWIMPFR
jgi:hypothetical protein